MRVVIDANVTIAAVASRGLCEAVVVLCLEHHEIIVCEGILKEVKEKLRDKLKVPQGIIAEYMKVLRSSMSVLEPTQVDDEVCRDANDLMVLGLVEPGHIDTIITGDKDLLVIGEYTVAKILTPRAFWELDQRRQ